MARGQVGEQGYEAEAVINVSSYFHLSGHRIPKGTQIINRPSRGGKTERRKEKALFRLSGHTRGIAH